MKDILLPHVKAKLKADEEKAKTIKAKPRTEPSSDAYLALIFGIIGLLVWPLGIVALITGRRAEQAGGPGVGMAHAGMVLGLLDVGVGVLVLIMLAVMS